MPLPICSCYYSVLIGGGWYSPQAELFTRYLLGEELSYRLSSCSYKEAQEGTLRLPASPTRRLAPHGDDLHQGLTL